MSIEMNKSTTALMNDVGHRLQSRQPLPLKELFGMIEDTREQYNVQVYDSDRKTFTTLYFDDSRVVEVEFTSDWTNEIIIRILGMVKS
jgi:uncharacterized protein YpuA (DUF1002 family)